jgi:hypothetical protein
MTKSIANDADSITRPAVRKDFWEFLISRHPTEEDYARSTKNAYRWRHLTNLRLVVVQFISQYGVGVFVRGEKGITPAEVEYRLRPRTARLKKAGRELIKHAAITLLTRAG